MTTATMFSTTLRVVGGGVIVDESSSHHRENYNSSKTRAETQLTGWSQANTKASWKGSTSGQQIRFKQRQIGQRNAAKGLVACKVHGRNVKYNRVITAN